MISLGVMVLITVLIFGMGWVKHYEIKLVPVGEFVTMHYFIRKWKRLTVLFVAMCAGADITRAGTNVYNFTYATRSALLADGWDFLARTAAGQTRNTESVVGSSPPDISYDQDLHPGILVLPVGSGDLWAAANDSTNNLFRNLSTNWISLRLKIAYVPTASYQQVNLAVYQDDDNYVEIGHGLNGSVGGEAIMLLAETGGVQLGSPRIVSSVGVSLSSVYLRLDRDLTNDFIVGYYSVDGANWNLLEGISQELVNPRVCIWAGGNSLSAQPLCSLQSLEVITSDGPLQPLLISGPGQLVFNATAGVPNTNTQEWRVVAKRSPDPLDWRLTPGASWLKASPTNGMTPGNATVSIDTAGLPAGVYKTFLLCQGSNAVATSNEVILIVNPNQRVRAATWYGGRKGAMSVSVDDSRFSGYEKLNAQGLKGTYYLWGLSPYEPFVAYRLAGMEMGAHTVDHPCYLVNEPTRRYELTANIAGIVAGTGATPEEVISFAWPCGQTTIKDMVIAEDYFLSSRGYNFNELEDASPRNWMNLKSFNSHENNAQELNPGAPPNPPDFKPLVDAAVSQGKWFNLVLHSMNDDDDAIAYSVGKDLWVAPIGSVVRYIHLRERTVFTNYLETATNLSFNLYRLPLAASRLRSFEPALTTNDQVTIEIDITGIATVGTLMSGGNQLPFRIRQAGPSRLLFFDALVTTNSASVNLVLNSPNPIAVDQFVTTFEDGPTNLVLLGSGQAGHSLAYSVVNMPTNGTLAGTAPNLTYTPETNYHGLDVFTFRVTDTISGLSATGLVNLAISAVNDAPVVVNPFPDQEGRFATPFFADIAGVFFNPDTDPISYSAMGLPPGLQLSTAGDISGAPTTLGEYVVALIARDETAPFLAATNVFNFVIGPSNALVNLGNLDQIYNGTARVVAATTEPPGLNVAVTYDDLPSAPTNAGVYTVTGIIDEPNYFGGATNTLIVAKSNAALSLLNLNQLFDGTPRVVSSTTEPNGLTVQLTYAGTASVPVAVGSYTVIGTIIEPNYSGGITNTLTVADGPLVIQSVSVSDDMDVVIAWQSVSNFSYRLEYRDSLDIAEWQALPPVTATGTTTTMTNAAVGNSRRFYRVLLLP